MADSPTTTTPNHQPVAVLIGLALFAVFSAVIYVLAPLKDVDPESLPSARTWVWWTAKEFLEQKKAPEVVLVGPSALMHGTARADANYLGKEFDYLHHHRSEYLADTLKKSIPGTPADLSCFNFALPGSLASDNYLVVHGLLKDERKPKVIVLGMTLRDLCDCLVTCPASTPPFKYLKRYSNIDDVAHLAMPQIWMRIDYFLGKYIYVHGKKLDIQVVLSDKIKRTFGSWCQSVFPPSRLVESDPSRNMPGNMRSEVEEGMYIVRPNIPLSFEDNTKEYQRRYRKANEGMYQIQSNFLDRLMKDCSDRGIRLVVFNVPITNENKKVMPEGYYKRYLETLTAMTGKWGHIFLDLGDSPEFSKADFYDHVHTNASGGKKILDAVAATITKDQRSIAALIGAGKTQVAAKEKPSI